MPDVAPRTILITVEELLAAEAYPAYLSPATILARAKALAVQRGLDLRLPYTMVPPQSWVHGVIEFRQALPPDTACP